MSNGDNAIAISDLHKRYGRQVALEGVSLNVRPGEILGLLGPNGAGKSTLVRAIAGRVRPDRGSISILGTPAPPGDYPSRQFLGWIPQEIALYPLLSVEQNVTTFGRYAGLRGEVLTEGVDRALSWSGLGERRRDKTSNLSGGMRRRLNMAAGVIHQPKVMLMDEPTVGVDPQSREKIYTMIEQMKSDAVSIVYTTHYMEEAERLCDRIAVIDHGHIIAEGTRADLIDRTVGSARTARVECAAEIPPEFRASIEKRGGRVDGRIFEVVLREPREIDQLFHQLAEHGIATVDLSVRAPTLESVFLHLTGRELRE